MVKRVRAQDVRDAKLRAMVDEGLVTLAARKGPTPPPHWKPIKLKGNMLSTTVIEDREDCV
jgi:hypothetical protein